MSNTVLWEAMIYQNKLLIHLADKVIMNKNEIDIGKPDHWVSMAAERTTLAKFTWPSLHLPADFSPAAYLSMKVMNFTWLTVWTCDWGSCTSQQT